MCAHTGLRRRISRDGFFAVDVARVFARHRILPGVEPEQTVSYGFERDSSQIDALFFYKQTQPYF